ncbi:hypothetical protein RYX36_019077, partial [Vicia faba]
TQPESQNLENGRTVRVVPESTSVGAVQYGRHHLSCRSDENGVVGVSSGAVANGG